MFAERSVHSAVVFTKILRPVVSSLRARGFVSIIYLDDLLYIGENYESCKRNVTASVEVLESLGFTIYYKKSVLIPTQVCSFLGYNINSRDMSLELPSKKRENTRALVQVFSRRSECKIREFARFVGTLVASSPALEYSCAYLKAFQREIFQAFLENDQNYEARMHILISLRKDFD